ncbi:hypothetical protein [Listeria grayi]|uniref:hypothetical protein n=1 Tax=Listeria grayi TaxID=1641 RepID=UPI00162A9FBC|nr:hypothetical protein [Listeria grayi]MBC1923002.1 hypothetical protein [Listeria grayi]
MEKQEIESTVVLKKIASVLNEVQQDVLSEEEGIVLIENIIQNYSKRVTTEQTKRLNRAIETIALRIAEGDLQY